jgi:hypothetical protein
VSGSDPDATVIIKVDTLTGAASGLGRPMSSTAAAATAPLATGDFGWLLRGMVERRVGGTASTGLTVDKAAGGLATASSVKT